MKRRGGHSREAPTHCGGVETLPVGGQNNANVGSRAYLPLARAAPVRGIA